MMNLKDDKFIGLKWLKNLICIAVIGLFSVFLVFLMQKNNAYIRGNDIYGHLYKARLLYERICEGDIYPIFDKHWYSGITLFTYWPPLSYYFIAFLMFLFGTDIYKVYFIFSFLMWFLSGSGWVLFAHRENKYVLCTIIGIFYIMFPENCKVFFSEGNVPRIFITMLLPYLFYFVCEFMLYDNKKAVIGVDIFTMLIIGTHFMTAAMVGVSVFLFLFFWTLCNKNLKRSVILLANMVSAYMAMGIILLPGLTGGIVTQNSQASQDTSGNMWSRAVIDSLNPVLFLKFPIEFYFGIFVFLVTIVGIIVWHMNTLPFFATVITIYAGTSMIALPIVSLLPMSQVFWMTRFIPIAYTIFCIGMIHWFELKRSGLCVLLVLLGIDCSLSFIEWTPGERWFKSEETLKREYLLDEAMVLTDNKIAFMDMSNIGSYTSYIITDDRNDIDSIFGWAYQGAYTIEEIVELNEAFQNGYYNYVFDRLIRYGCDTVLVKKDEVLTSYERMMSTALNLGYEVAGENEVAILFDHIVKEPYGVEFNYENACLGHGSEYMSYLYPSFYKLHNKNIDDYTFDELKQFKNIYITGPEYKDKEFCEQMLRDLSDAGVHIFIDMNSIPSNKSTGRNTILGVVAQPVNFTDKFPILERDDGSQFKLEFNGDEWRTVYFTNLDNVTKKAQYEENKYLAYLGKSENENITFIGLNLVYFQGCGMNGDSELYNFLDDVFQVSRTSTPERILRPVKVTYDKNDIEILSDYDNIMVGISNLDSFVSEKDTGKEVLVLVDKGITRIRTEYKGFKKSLIVSLFGLTVMILFCIFTIRKRKAGV